MERTAKGFLPGMMKATTRAMPIEMDRCCWFGCPGYQKGGTKASAKSQPLDAGVPIYEPGIHINVSQRGPQAMRHCTVKVQAMRCKLRGDSYLV
eukprot:9480742-Pyramimonas_sp.AAC.1